jgi:hypothetical protein
MKNLSARRILASLLMLSLFGVMATAAFAEDEEVTLIGQLAKSEAGGYVLIEQDSGDSITVTGPAELEHSVGAKVKLTGSWMEDESGARYFAVTKVEPAE